MYSPQNFFSQKVQFPQNLNARFPQFPQNLSQFLCLPLLMVCKSELIYFGTQVCVPKLCVPMKNYGIILRSHFILLLLLRQ